MPKFYVRESNNFAIIDSADATMACAKLLFNGIFKDFLVNGYYFVSEHGFTPSLETQKINSGEVNDLAAKLFFDNSR